MFDIDGTLVNSSSFEDACYSKAVREVIKHPVDTDWTKYINVTDSGILHEIINKNGLDKDRDNIHREVKLAFIRNIKSHLRHTQVKEISGASTFIQLLRQRDDVVLAIATGGWEETARLKLESAGIDYSGIAFASGSDHVGRIDIMKTAEAKCLDSGFCEKSYFGDAIWDKKASQALGFNFILVGNQISHAKQILNFNNSDKVLELIGL
jgi:beta-phosphoglucomutase-like phosphatase (HAD superfamily)